MLLENVRIIIPKTRSPTGKTNSNITKDTKTINEFIKEFDPNAEIIKIEFVDKWQGILDRYYVDVVLKIYFQTRRKLHLYPIDLSNYDL